VNKLSYGCNGSPVHPPVGNGYPADYASPLFVEIPMSRIRALARNFLTADDAIAVTEYGLLVALVAVLLIGVVTVFGSSIKSWFAARTSQITTV
jgi:Flp pilus assembly pilin Flp